MMVTDDWEIIASPLRSAVTLNCSTKFQRFLEAKRKEASDNIYGAIILI